MTQYFVSDPDRPSHPRIITFWFRGVEEQFLSDDGVFSKDTLDFGSRVLLEAAVDQEISGRVLDLGCGWGPVGILLKKAHPDIALTLCDINERAAALAQENSRRYGQDNETVVSDGLANVGGRFDLVVINPPIRAGKETVYRLLDEARQALTPTGRLMLVIQKKQGAESCLKHLQASGSARLITRQKGYWVLTADAPHSTD
jgi:16S rRNA (guanine1207-N2)-methyltransferase